MIVVYDIEVLRNFFLYLDYNLDTGEISSFEISDFVCELGALLVHLKKIKAQIGYNNLNYDAQIIEHLLKHQHKLKKLPPEEIYTFLYEYSQYVINKQNENKFLDYYETKLSIPQLDLFRVWHFDNKQRRCSLKWLQYSMDWYNIEDMPINHYDYVNTEESREKIKYYCKNDVLSTLEFYNVTRGNTEHPEYKGKDKIKFRKDISKQLNINCRNFSDVKIGDEINKVNYLRATGKQWRDIKYLRGRITKFTFGDCYPSYTEFKIPELVAFVDRLKDIYIDINSKQDFSITLDGVEYILAKGGLHSKDRSRIIRPEPHQILRDADVGSMYPRAIEKRKLFPNHLGEQWLDGYIDVIKQRLLAKKEYEQTNDLSKWAIVEALKLALNGGSFGKTQDPTNWQYDPFVTFCVTIGCQIDLLMLIEKLLLAKIRVMSANTDGVVCLFDKDQESVYNEVCIEWEKAVGNYELGKLEYSDYQLIAQTNVNDYIAVKTNGKVKWKGDFLINYELHKNKSFRIIPLALNEHYSTGINPTSFIRNHTNIFDFCAAVRAREGWHFELRETTEGELKTINLPKTNRYYISNRGLKMIKCNQDGRESQTNAGKWVCTLYNKHNEKNIEEYDINYDFYIAETYKIISKIQPEITGPNTSQLVLF